jgi:RND superfamily putative drug exporter
MTEGSAPVTAIVRWCLQHKRIVAGFWLVLMLVGMGTAGKASKALNSQYSNPGHESYTTNLAISREFGNGGSGAPLLAVVTLPAGVSVRSPAVTSGLNDVAARIEHAVPHVRVASFASTRGDRAFVSRDGRTTFVIAYPPPSPNAYGASPLAVKQANAVLKGVAVAGGAVHVTGLDALMSPGGQKSGPNLLLEGMIGALGALVVLAFVFGSVLAVVPLITALVSIMTSFLLIWGLTAVWTTPWTAGMSLRVYLPSSRRCS